MHRSPQRTIGRDQVLFVDFLEDRAVPAVLNPGFETGDFSDWNITGTAVIVDDTYDVLPPDGDFQALLSNSGFVTQNDIENFLGLATGSIINTFNNNPTSGSAIAQTVTVAAGDQFRFFGAL